MITILIILALLLCVIMYNYTQCFTYWKKKGIYFIKPKIPMGNLECPLKRIPISLQLDKFYKSLRNAGQKYGGVFCLTQAIFILVDPELIRNMFVKDFQYFSDRGLLTSGALYSNLLFSEYKMWKNLRKKSVSVFSSVKVKSLFNDILKRSNMFVSGVKELARSNKSIEIKYLSDKFASDVISFYTYGIDCNSFLVDSPLLVYVRKLIDENIFKSLFRATAWLYYKTFTKFNYKPVSQEIDNFFTKLAMDTYHDHKNDNAKHNDVIQELIEIQQKDEGYKLTIEDIVGQTFLFFAAGFDTASTTISFCLFELAANSHIQNKLRQEIKSILEKHNGEIDYESVQDMKYMEQVIHETLRKYPVLPYIVRRCVKAYNIPNTNATIDEDTKVLISVFSLHRDPAYFPEPEIFDPERFSNENKHKIMPGTYLGFGDGPRNCIGMQLGLTMVKVCLTNLLVNFEFTVNPKTKTPIELDWGIVFTAKGGIWLDATEIS